LRAAAIRTSVGVKRAGKGADAPVGETLDLNDVDADVIVIRP